MKHNLNTLTVLRNLLNNNVFSLLSEYDKDDISKAVFRSAVFGSECENCLLGFIEELILTDENAFSLQTASKKAPSQLLKDAYKRDIAIIYSSIDEICNAENFGKGSHIYPFADDIEVTVKNLNAFYQNNGYGKFIRNAAFRYTDNQLLPILHLTQIKLSDLKNYAEEKETIEKNIKGFLNGLPALDMLLYGEKGTGKSSTVRAMLDKYFGSGLRIIEMDLDSINQIGQIRQTVAKIPLKFIIYIDDLSLQGDDDRLSAIKAGLEGSFSSDSRNTMIVATSNRRHIVKENFSDRQDAVHSSDIIGEQLSLSDRFGLTILFSATNKSQYLSIVQQLADDYGLKINTDELYSLAERWALLKGGRSPRHAKQFIELAYSLSSRGLAIKF